LDVAEYRYDIAVRHRLEIILRALGQESQDRLRRALEPLDAEFKKRMKPEPGVSESTADEPFWVTHTIWNTSV
jgi:hypothetical protein